MRGRGYRTELGVWALCLLASKVAVAREPVPAHGTPTMVGAVDAGDRGGDDEERAAAVELFQRGMALLHAGDLERAAELLLSSRSRFPSKGNTLNAAIVLDRLGRFDEALGLYEETIAVHRARLDAEEQIALPGVIDELRRKLAALDVTSNVPSAVALVDGRERGRLPLSSSIPVLPGEHVVRVVLPGYETFETRIVIGARERRALHASLAPLMTAGGIRVEDTLAGSQLTVDGAEVGVCPWEGLLAPGDHVVWSRRDNLGSEPTRAVVVAGQTALIRLHAAPLGEPTEIAVEPRSARIRLSSGALLGTGTWRGFLPVGSHTVEAEDLGYRPRRVTFTVVPERANAPINLALSVDPNHPRWAKPGGAFFMSAWVSGVGGASLGSSAEGRCPEACAKEALALGMDLGMRAGFELSSHFSLAGELGFLSVARDVTRTHLESENRRATYELDDRIHLSGLRIGVAGGHRARLGKRWDLETHLSTGVWLVSATDDLDDQAERAGSAVFSSPIYVNPSIGVAFEVGRARIGVSVGGLWVLGPGLCVAGGCAPEYAPSVVRVSNAACTTPGSAACSTDRAVLGRERPYGSIELLATGLYGAIPF